MFYRLGHFRSQPGSHDYEALHQHPELSGPMLDALEEMLQARLSRTELREGEPTRNAATEAIPDLLPALPPDSPEREWVSALHGRLVELEATLSIRLLACEYEPGREGFLCVAGTSPSIRAEVRERDWVQAGFVAFRAGTAPLRLSSRVFRLVCANGSIVSVAEFDDAHVAGNSLPAALNRCFDQAAFADVVRGLAASSREQVPSMADLFADEMARLAAKHHQKVYQWFTQMNERLLRDVEVAVEATTWDVVNALTEVARDLPDWGDRIDLEEAAGRLALLHRPIPARVAANVESVPA